MQPFTVITPTGDRPEPFSLCCLYMERQTVKPKEWIIVDDGQIETIPPHGSYVNYVRRVNTISREKHTLPFQMIEALRHVTTSRVVIIEDDDWYCQNYLEEMMNMFDKHGAAWLIGQGQAIYYHVRYRRYYEINNMDRASFCQTGFRSEFIPNVLSVCQKTKVPFIDLQLWFGTKRKFLLIGTNPMCIGIKGMPGRITETTIGHKGTHPGFKEDSDLSKLQSYIGNDAFLYEKYLTHTAPPIFRRSRVVGGFRGVKT